VEDEAKAAWWREKVQGDLSQPSTMPLQPKVPNTVRLPILVGSIGAPAPAAHASTSPASGAIFASSPLLLPPAV
jgi:hypothetical protein